MVGATLDGFVAGEARLGVFRVLALNPLFRALRVLRGETLHGGAQTPANRDFPHP
jgi:hypothetical protein